MHTINNVYIYEFNEHGGYCAMDFYFIDVFYFVFGLFVSGCVFQQLTEEPDIYIYIYLMEAISLQPYH